MENEGGVMQAVRDLLAGGLNSREVIENGYAPGTVYKVQKQLRKRNCEALPPEPVTCQEPEQGPVSEPWEIQVMRQRDTGPILLVTDEQLKIEGLQRRVSELVVEACVAQRERVELESRLNGLTRESLRMSQENDRLNQALKLVRSENTYLKRYLSSKNCGWQHDF
ncbi:MAG: hypothetical protein QGI79_01805, partial [Dehalococcoidia bacterium]|nr:hypothetical protein [Dehalococcoidia bacterium]